MKIVNFENKLCREKEEVKREIIKQIDNSTNFMFIYSTDNVDSTGHIYFNFKKSDVIAALEVTKFHTLMEVYYPDDGAQKDIAVEGGV